MKLLKEFKKNSTHPEFPGVETSHTYYTNGTDIFVTVKGLTKTWTHRKIIPGQSVEVYFTSSKEELGYLAGSVELEGDLGYIHLRIKELEWLAAQVRLTLNKPSEEDLKEFQNDNLIYSKERQELKELFEKNGFRVKEGLGFNDLEIIKKDVTVNVWIDVISSKITYQVGYKENPFYKKKECKKRETLLRQANDILTQAINGSI